MWSHPLPLHWSILSRDDRPDLRARFWHRDRWHLWLVRTDLRYPAWKQAHLVDDGAGLGEILVTRGLSLLKCANVRSWHKAADRRDAAIRSLSELKRK